jgi:integrase
MASLHQIEKSPYWYVAYTLASGQRVFRSTGETQYDRAKIKMGAIVRMQAEARRPDTDRRFFERIMEEALRDLNYETNPEPTVKAWLTEWLGLQHNTVGAATLGKYSHVIREFLGSLGLRSNLRLSKIGEGDFHRFRDELLRSGRSPTTVNSMVRVILKLPFTHAINSGKLIRNPLNLVKPIREKASVKGIFTVEQVQKLLGLTSVNLESEDWQDWQGMILTAFYSGARLGDIKDLRWQDVDFDDQTITFVQKKTGGQVVIPVHPSLWAWLERKAPLLEHRKSQGYFDVFLYLTGKSTQQLSKQFSDLMDLAGIEKAVLRVRRGPKSRSVHSLSFHSFRHTFTSALFNAGVPADVRSKLTGHGAGKNVSSHMRYSHAQLETLRAAISVLPNLP